MRRAVRIIADPPPSHTQERAAGGASQSFFKLMRMEFSMSKRLGLNLWVSSHADSEASNIDFIFS